MARAWPRSPRTRGLIGAASGRRAARISCSVGPMELLKKAGAQAHLNSRAALDPQPQTRGGAGAAAHARTLAQWMRRRTTPERGRDLNRHGAGAAGEPI